MKTLLKLLFLAMLVTVSQAAQQPMLYSSPVVIASDQSAITVKINPVAPTIAATLVEGVKAPAALATPEALAASTLVHSVIIKGQRTARVSNASSVWIGATSTNDAQQIEIPPGASVTITAPPGKYIDLATIFVDAVTLTDGVVFLATQ